MTKFRSLIWDTQKYLTNQKCFIITGSNTAFLTAFLNSSLFQFCCIDNFPKLGEQERELSKIFFDKTCIPTDNRYRKTLQRVSEGYSN